MRTTSAAKRRTGARFLRFAGVSGLGWLLDATLLMLLVLLLGWAPAVANTVSSCCAAVTVFLVSRQTVFDKAAHHLLPRVAAYVGYTLVLILLASLAVQWIVGAVSPWVVNRWPAHASGIALAMAKIIVTPPQLLSNFIVSRLLIERFSKAPPKRHG